nr:MBL fold metallo-hydrolase [Allosalinactinospora lopnorensis]
MSAAGRAAVTFAGSGDAFGSGGRFQAYIHIRPPRGEAVLLDCGATSLAALKRQGLDPGDIGTVFVSHLHGDHFGGLPFLVLDGQFAKRSRPLRVAGPQGTAQRLTEAMEAMFPGSSTAHRRFAVQIVELQPGRTARVGDIEVDAWEVAHPAAHHHWRCVWTSAEPGSPTPATRPGPMPSSTRPPEPTC